VSQALRDRPVSDRSERSGGTDFDAIAEEYDQSLPGHVVEHYLAKRLAYIQQHTEPGLALEVGCGTGLLAERLADADYEVVALDPSRGMLGQLQRRRPGMLSVAALGEALPFPDDRFALTYCIAVMHHVAEPDAVRSTLLEMVRVTRPDGHILIWDHNPRNPYWPLLMRRVPQDTGAERLIPESELCAGLTLGGATVIENDQLGLVPDFAPRALLGLVTGLERIVEASPGLRRLCAHNVLLAVKNGG
jgi:SAM-dependent methyltransferase